jgi:hypothetical protein
MKKLLVLFILATLVYSCNETYPTQSLDIGTVDYESSKYDDEDQPTNRQLKTPPPSPPVQSSKVENNTALEKGIEKKIIKDGRIGIETKTLQKTKAKLDLLLKKYGGYYASENFNNTNWNSSFELKIRIPYSNFEKFIVETETSNGEILYKVIEARDVTDQFIDIETRLKSKRNYLNRYNDLLKQAKSIKDILEIGEKIRRLEEEIESATGRLNYLSDQVKYSTLNLTITAEKEVEILPTNREGFFTSLKQSLSKGWFGFVDFLLFLVKGWPFLIVLALTYYLWKKFRKRKK